MCNVIYMYVIELFFVFALVIFVVKIVTVSVMA